MNMLDMYGVYYEIYRDLRNKTEYAENDEAVLDLIFRLYNMTEIDCEEIRALWIEYLTKGTLSIRTHIQNARSRMW